MIFRLTNLKKLVLCYHGITTVPDKIGELKQLNHFDISCNPYLQSLSAELGGLPLKREYLLKL